MSSLTSILEELRTHLASSLDVTVGYDPVTPPTDVAGSLEPFIAIIPTPGTDRTRLGGGAAGRQDTVQVRCVAGASLTCLRLADDVQAALTGWRPTQAGRGARPLAPAGFEGVPISVEPGEGPTRYSTVLTYGWASTSRRTTP